MKSTLKMIGIIALVAVIGFAMTACGGRNDSPSDVVRKAITAMERGDTRGIEATCTPELAALIISMMEKAQGQVTERGGIASAVETIDGDTAIVEVTYNDGTSETMNLVKVDGQWKITMGK